MKHALFLPPFGELADPRIVMDLALAAEERAWDGLFLWDHILRPPAEPAEIADVWVILAAVAAVTSRLRLGPMVTPLVRRRPQKVARETVTLDHLSGGRLTVGVGLGVDTAGELSKFGEVLDPKERGDVLDESLELLVGLWSGQRVDHRGPHFTAHDVTYSPSPVQRPRIPIWVAARATAQRPVRRAARYDGMFPIDVDRDGLARMVDLVGATRGGLDGFDVAVLASPGFDEDDHARRGATWAMWELPSGATGADAWALIARR